jgi:hypothetical protein
MQRHIICAFPILLLSGLASVSPSWVSPASAGSMQHGHHRQQHSHPISNKHAPLHQNAHHGSQKKPQVYSPAAPAPVVAPAPRPVTVATPVLTLPLNPVFPAPRQIIALAPEPLYLHHQPVYQAERRFTPEPSSFVPTDPRAVISELPSGRIFMGAPAGVHYPQQRSKRWSRNDDSSRPYAPPSIQIIGDLPRRHMGSPVRLTQTVESVSTLARK